MPVDIEGLIASLGLNEDRPIILLSQMAYALNVTETTFTDEQDTVLWTQDRDGNEDIELLPRMLAEWELFAIGTDAEYRPDVARAKLYPLVLKVMTV